MTNRRFQSTGSTAPRGLGRTQLKIIPVTLAERLHPFPSRTRKLSSPAPKILGGQPPGKIGRRRDFHFPPFAARLRARRRTRARWPFGRSILEPMERICPFLATGIDGRTVVDGFDGGHVCRASDDRRPLERAQQQAYCLGGAHPGCERFADAMRRRGPISWPAPAADATVIQTRLVLPASRARRPSHGMRPPPHCARRTSMLSPGGVRVAGT